MGGPPLIADVSQHLMADRNYLDEFLGTAANRPYRSLVEYHMRRQSIQQLAKAAMGETAMLPQEYQPEVMGYLDAVNAAVGYDARFWASASCDEAMKTVLRIADPIFRLHAQVDVEDPIKSQFPNLAFQLFQIPTLNFAYSAAQDRRQRKFMGIRKGIFG